MKARRSHTKLKVSKGERLKWAPLKEAQATVIKAENVQARIVTDKEISSKQVAATKSGHHLSLLVP